jgi:hypothetical protein
MSLNLINYYYSIIKPPDASASALLHHLAWDLSEQRRTIYSTHIEDEALYLLWNSDSKFPLLNQ